MVNARLAVEHRERPESDERQAVGVDWATERLGDEVIRRAKPQRREPETEHIMGIPPVDERLLDAEMDVRDLGDYVEDREPEQGCTDVPHRNVQVMDVALTQREEQRHR